MGLITLSIIGLSVITVLLVGLYSALREVKRFKTESDDLRTNFIEIQKRVVKNEVEKAVDYIDYNRSLAQERVKNNLKTRVNEAWDIANNIYLENKGRKPDSEIKKMISDALRPIRFSNGRGDVFIYTTDGVSVMLPRSRNFENKPSLGLRDSLGNYLVKNEVRLLEEVDQGYLAYRAPVNSQEGDSAIFKYTYIKRFAPYNWYLGSKDYLKDYEGDLKSELLEWLANVRYGNEGYIFVNSLDGKALLTNGVKPDMPQHINQSGDTNWINVFRLQQRIATTSGSGFIEYKFRRLASNDFSRKVSYIRYLSNWGWIVGAGFYKNDIESEISAKQAELTAGIKDWGIRFSVFLLLFLAMAVVLAKVVSDRLKKEFGRFTDSFRKASLDSVLMDQNQIAFSEFRTLAESVNKTIVERDYARNALEKEQSLLRSLIDSIPDFVFFKDVDSNYVGCNLAFARFVGRPEKDIIGKNDYDFFPPEAAGKYHEADRQILRDHNPIRSEEWNIFPDGSRHLLDTVKVLYYDTRGDVLGIMAISRDITEREEVQQQFKAAKEKAEESDHLKTAFLANMSHEIRTPMNSIIGFSTLLTENNLTENDRAEYIQHINQAGESLLNLIDDIIDIAKIEAGQLTVSQEYYSLNEMMEELYLTYSDMIHRKFNRKVSLSVESSSLPKGNVIFTDPFRLKQVLSNLLGNAVKFTQEGMISFGFRMESDTVLFYVRDTGVGISEENQQIIFHRFRQAQNSGKKHNGGTGLGLAISQHIVDLLGGKIWVESSQGEGSVFYFTVPYKPVSSQNGEGRITAKERSVLYDWSDKTMLMIEDVDPSFNYISAALSRTGINIIRVTDENSGIEACSSDQKIDLVLIDINLHDSAGRSIPAEIKKLRPQIPVIAQTASGIHDGHLNGNAVCDDYITKPVKFNVLMNILSKYLETNE